MKQTLRLLVILLCVLSLWPADAKPKRDFVYIHDRRTGGGILGYEMIDDALTPLAGSPFALIDESDNSGISGSMAYSKKRKLLFTSGYGGLTAWDVAADGIPTVVDGSPFGLPESTDIEGRVNFTALAVVDKGKKTYVYAADDSQGVVLGYIFDSKGNATLIDGLPIVLAEECFQVQATKKVLLVARYDALVEGFRIGKNGKLTPGKADPSPVRSGNFFVGITLDPKGGKYLYAANFEDGLPVDVLKLKPSTTALTPIDGSPFDSGFPAEIGNGDTVVASKGKVLFVVSKETGGDTDLQPLLRGKKGALAIAGPGQESGLARLAAVGLDAKGEHLVVSSGTNNKVRLYSVDKKTGALTMLDEESIDNSAGMNTAVFVSR